MTTITCRDGVMAADSLATYKSEEGGSRTGICEKIFRKTLGRGRRRFDVLIGTAGDVSPSRIFVDWYGSRKPPPDIRSSDFMCLILTPEGMLEADEFCRPQRVCEPYWAIGCGAKAAMAAMDCGKSAIEAVRIAAKRDPFTGPPFVSMSLNEEGKQAKRRRRTR